MLNGNEDQASLLSIKSVKPSPDTLTSEQTQSVPVVLPLVLTTFQNWFDVYVL
jgi:hypothetical protein